MTTALIERFGIKLRPRKGGDSGGFHTCKLRLNPFAHKRDPGRKLASASISCYGVEPLPEPDGTP